MGAANSALQEQLANAEKGRKQDIENATKKQDALQARLDKMELDEKNQAAENATKKQDALQARLDKMELDEKNQAAESTTKEQDVLQAWQTRRELDDTQQAAANATKEQDVLRARQAQTELEEIKQAAEKEAGPWREAFSWTESEYDSFLEKIKLHQPIGEKATRAKIILVGRIGAGKSSFINTVFAMKGRETRRAPTASCGYSVTKKFMAYKKAGENYKFSIYDTMGMEDDRAGFNTEHFQNAIAGHLKDGYDFSTEKDKQSDKWRDNPTLEHRMHAVIFVVNCSTIKTMDDPTILQIKDLRKKANDMGISVAIVLTHCDKAFEHIGQNIRQLYIDRKVKDAVDAAAHVTGVPAYNIFPVVNDVIGVAHDDIRHLAAYVFSTILTFANDFLENQMKDDDD